MKWGERPFAVIVLEPVNFGNIGEEDTRVQVASCVAKGVIPRKDSVWRSNARLIAPYLEGCMQNMSGFRNGTI